jgi:hypothetical protein
LASASILASGNGSSPIDRDLLLNPTGGSSNTGTTGFNPAGNTGTTIISSNAGASPVTVGVNAGNTEIFPISGSSQPNAINAENGGISINPFAVNFSGLNLGLEHLPAFCPPPVVHH